MTSPTNTGSIIVPNSNRYGARYRLDAAGKQLKANGRDPILIDLPPTNGTRAQFSKLYGRSIYTPPAYVDRDSLVIGVDRPTTKTTGLSDPSLLTEWTGSYSFTGIGTQANPIVVKDKWFTKKININGAWYRFENCWFSGGWEINEPPIQCTNTNCRNNLIIDSVIWPQNPQNDSPMAKGWQITVKRSYVRGCTDGIAHIGYGSNGTATGDYTTVTQNVNLLQNLIEKGSYMSPDYGAAGKLPDNASHLDLGMQTRGGKDFLVKGNAIYGFIDPLYGEGGLASVDMLSGTHLTGKRVSHTGPYTLSLFMFSPILGTITNWVADSNWLDGSDIPFVFAEHLAGISVTNNRVGRLQRGEVGLVLAKQEAVIPITGNHFWYELGPNGEKWPYNRTPNPEYGETLPNSTKLAQWDSAGIIPTNENTWPSANLRARG